MPEYSHEYLVAWGAYRALGYRFEGLSEQQLKALSSDLETKTWIDNWRRQCAYEAEQAAAKQAQEAARLARAQPVKKATPAQPQWTEPILEKALDAWTKAFVEGARADWDQFVEAHMTLPVPLAVLEFFALGPLVSVNEKNKTRNQRISVLEAKVATLEARPPGGAEYVGVFEGGKTYRPGMLVTRRGLWLCTADTTLAPGTAPTCWKLVCKERSGGNREG